MITIEELQKLGFKDISSDKNGLAYRKNLDSILEVCYYVGEPYLRLQTQRSGFTHELKGIENKYHLKSFWLIMTNRNLD